MNKSTKHNIINNFKIVFLSLVITIASGYAYAQVVSNEYPDGEWTPPQDIAPSGNTPAPINVGSLSQVKAGGFGAANILTAAFQMTGGNPALNKVLVSTNNEGNATWKDLSEVGGSGSVLDYGIVESTTGDGTKSKPYVYSSSITLTQPGIIIMSGWGGVSYNGGTQAQINVQVSLMVNDNLCGYDRTQETTASTISIWASPSCVTELPIGTYEIKMIQDKGDNGNMSNTKGKFQYVVFAK